MFTQRDDDLLTLLATMIFADKRVFAKEIEAFVDMAQRLHVGSERSKPVTRSTLLLWFEANKATLCNIHEHPDFENWLNEHLDRLKDYPGKSALLKMMNDIAASDGEVHVSETALCVLAARRWKLRAA